MPKPQDIFQLAQQEAVRVTASPQAWQSFLYTTAHNYHTTYLNQLLIHAQRPDAAACASMEYWNKQANRLVMRGSRSITVLQRRQGVAVTKPVFAIGDTTLLSQTRTGGPWEVTEEVQISTEYKKFQILLFYILHNDMFGCFSCFHICPRKF